MCAEMRACRAKGAVHLQGGVSLYWVCAQPKRPCFSALCSFVQVQVLADIGACRAECFMLVHGSASVSRVCAEPKGPRLFLGGASVA